VEKDKTMEIKNPKGVLDDYKHAANAIRKMKEELKSDSPDASILRYDFAILVQHFDKMFIDLGFDVKEISLL